MDERNYSIQTYDDIETLNTNDATLIPKNHLADSMNMVRRDDGLWEKRKGLGAMGDDIASGNPTHSLVGWRIADGTRYLTAGSGMRFMLTLKGLIIMKVHGP